MGKNQLIAKDAAQILEVSQSYIGKLIRAGKLKATLQTGGPVDYYLIDRASVEDYAKNAKRRPGPPKGQGGRPRKSNK